MVRSFALGEPAWVPAAETPAATTETAPPETTPPAAETPTPTQTVETPAATPAAEVTPPAQFDWKKEIENIDRRELLKAKGLDDFAIDLIEYREKTGDLTPYLEVKTVDYTKMSPEELLKSDMRKQNPGMSDKALNFKLTKELNEKYFLDRETYPEGSEEAEFGQEQLRLDAEKLRQGFIENQSKFKAPEVQPDTAAIQREAALQQQREQLKASVVSNEVTQALKTQKSITFGQGEESFNYPVENIDAIIENAKDVLVNSGRTDLNGVDLKEFYEALVIAQNKNQFLDAYGKHREALAHKKFQSTLQNITPATGEQSIPPPPSRNYTYGEPGN